MNFLIIISCSILSFGPLIAKEQLVDQVKAIVNNDIILLSEMKKRYSEVHQGRKPYASASEENKQTVLKDLINETLVIQESDKSDLIVSEEEVDKQIENVLKQNQLSLDQLKEFLKMRQKTFEEYREEFERKLQIHNFMKMIINPKVKVSEDDISFALLNKGGKELLEFIQFHVKHIFIKKDPEAVAKLNQIVAQLKSGKPFEELAKKYSDDPSTREDGGNLGLIAKQDISPNLQTELVKMKPGTYSSPVKTDQGTHILKLVKIESGENPEVQKLKASITQQLTQQEIERQFQIWIKNKRKTSTIKIK